MNYTHRWASRLLLTLSVLLFAAAQASHLHAQDNSGPTIQTCSDRQIFCLAEDKLDLCVRINVPEGYGQQIESLTVDWGDNTQPLSRGAGNNSFEETHRYDFGPFSESCNYQMGPLYVILTVYVEGETDPIQSIFPLSVRNPPKAKIDDFPKTVCVGEEIYFKNVSCPTTGLTSEWDYGDGSAPDELGYHTFTEAGKYRVRLRVSNFCNSDELSTDEVSQEITVIDRPVVSAVADSGVVVGYDDPYLVCFDGRARVRLDGSDSDGVSNTRWNAIPSFGVSFENAGRRSTRATFTQAGSYQLILSGENDNCQYAAADTVYVDVLESTVLRLDQQPDVCESFAYCPSPAVDGATYTLNGQPLTGCSPVLEEGTYYVEAFLANDLCGDATLRDTFRISAQATAVIDQRDTTLCDQDSPLRLTATPADGSWTIDGQPFDGTVDPGALAPGTYRIAYGNEPCLLSDALTVVIVGSGVTVPDDAAVCLDGGPVTFTATPAGGTFQGVGISESGQFDPVEAGLGQHEITYVWEDGDLAGCGGSNTFTVTVSDLAVDFITLSCEGNAVCFAVEEAANYENVTWRFGDGSTATGAEPCHTFPGPGTYEVEVTGIQGPCQATQTRSITIAPAPVANFNLQYDADRCSDLPVTIQNTTTGSELAYVWRLNDTIFAEVADPAPLLLTARTRDTTYVISVEVTNGCITDTYRETIVVRALPTSDFGTDQNQYCSGDTILLANNALGQPTAYEWTLGGRIIGTDSLPPLIVHETQVRDTLEVCLTTYNDCGATTTCRPVVVTPTNVEAFFNVTPTVICVDDTVRLTNFATPGVAVRYDFGNGNASSEPNARVVYTRPGEYTITQRAFGCGSDVFTKTIRVVPRPTARFEAPVVICAGGPASFQNLSGDTLRASWDFGDGTAPSAEFNPTHVFDTAGRYEVCLTVTSMGPDGCDHTVCIDVEVSAAPRAGVAVIDSVCLGTELSVASSAAGDGLSCRYRFGDGAVATDCVAAHTYATPGTYQLTQTVTDRRGCTDSIQLPIFVRNLPEADFRPRAAEVCHPDSVELINLTQGAETFRWDYGDGRQSSGTAPRYAYEAPGSYTVTLTASDRFCADVATREVTVNASPAAAITVADTAVCYGETLLLTDGSTGPVTTRRWDFGDGTTAFTPEVTHPFAAPGRYLVRLRTSTAAGCVDSTQRYVVVNEPVTGAIAQTAEIACHGAETAGLDFTVGSGAEPFAYDWSNGTVTKNNDNLPAGPYFLTVTDANGCALTDSITVGEPTPVLPGAEITTVTCAGGSDGALGLQVSGGSSPYLIQWQDGSSGTSRDELAAGEYSLTITDGAGCRVPVTLEVPENPPLVVIDSLTGISCFGREDAALDLTEVSGGVAPYDVTLTGTGYRESGTTLTRFDRLKPDVYTLEVKDALDCVEERDIVIAQPDRVNVDILPDSVYLELGDTVRLLTRYNATEPAFEWTPAYGLSCNTCPDPVAGPHYNQRYDLRIADRRGCVASDSVYVAVAINRDIFLPNTFTPNGDGRNDVFRVRTDYPDAVAAVELFEIRDRWGMMLYSMQDFPPNDQSFGWDGTYNDAPVTGGQYVYQVRVRFVDGFTKTISGSILILR